MIYFKLLSELPVFESVEAAESSSWCRELFSSSHFHVSVKPGCLWSEAAEKQLVVPEWIFASVLCRGDWCHREHEADPVASQTQGNLPQSSYYVQVRGCSILAASHWTLQSAVRFLSPVQMLKADLKHLQQPVRTEINSFTAMKD